MIPNGKTLTEISDELRVRHHIVAYAQRSHGIAPTRRVGNVHLFAAPAVEQLAEIVRQKSFGNIQHP